MVVSQRSLDVVQQLLNNIQAPLRDYHLQLQTLEDIKPQLSAREYAIELANINRALADVSGPQKAYDLEMASAKAELEAHILTQDQYNQKVRELKQILNDATGEIDVVGGAWQSVWDQSSAALNQFIETGKMSFGDLANSILMDIEKIIGKMLLMQAFKAIGIPVPTFATGGSFMVGGRGGTDSQMVAFKASPNERVTVETPGQQMAGQAQPAAPAASPVIKVINVVDPNDIKDAMSSAQGEQVIMNVISRNRGAVRQAIS
jgi:hypothetical protein